LLFSSSIEDVAASLSSDAVLRATQLLNAGFVAFSMFFDLDF
jgi:hypothetical protein